MLVGTYRNPNGSTAEMLKEGAQVGQWENLASGFLAAPFAETALEGAAVAGDNALVHAYDTSLGAADVLGATENQYSPRRACGCK
jgi:hypothetical protein